MISISIVEDNEVIRERLERRVTEMPEISMVSAYPTGELALEGFTVNPPDIAIMDIGLPGMSGTELLARLVDTGFEGNTLMFTVFDNDEHLFKALQLGAAGYILKEEGPEGVVAAIEEHLKGGSPMSRSIAHKVLQSFRQKNHFGYSAKLGELTKQQYRILDLMAEGLLNKEKESDLMHSTSN